MYAGKYILAYLPGLYFMSLFELQRYFLIIMDRSDLQMYVIAAGTVLHLLWNYLLVIVMDLGVEGTGLAASLTNFIIFLGMMAISQCQRDLSEANKVGLSDSRVFKNLWEYFKIGFPMACVEILDWGKLEIVCLMVGLIGSKYQAAYVILINIVNLLW